MKTILAQAAEWHEKEARYFRTISKRSFPTDPSSIRLAKKHDLFAVAIREADGKKTGSDSEMKTKTRWQNECPPELFNGHAVLLELREMFPNQRAFPADCVSDVLDALGNLVKKRVQHLDRKRNGK